MEANPEITRLMEEYQENRAMMKQAQELCDEAAEIRYYHAAVRALKEARKLAGIG